MFTWLILFIIYCVMTLGVLAYDIFIGFDFDLDGNNLPPLALAALFWWITIPILLFVQSYRRVKYLLRHIKGTSPFAYLSNLRRKNRAKLANGKYFKDDYVAYYKEGHFHRLDGPAIEYYNGSWEWYKEGKLHREDGPARKDTNGTLSWYREGEFHRADGPAIIFPNGKEKFYLNDKEIICANQKHFIKITNLKPFW